MKPSLKATFWIFGFIFLTSGVAVIDLGSFPDKPWSLAIKPLSNVIYAIHLFCWMVLGMVANYLWDLFRADKGLRDVELSKLFLPVLVSPIVFYGVWSLVVPKGGSGYADIQIAWPFVSFQNGFFWQVVFSKSQKNA